MRRRSVKVELVGVWRDWTSPASGSGIRIRCRRVFPRVPVVGEYVALDNRTSAAIQSVTWDVQGNATLGLNLEGWHGDYRATQVFTDRLATQGWHIESLLLIEGVADNYPTPQDAPSHADIEVAVQRTDDQ